MSRAIRKSADLGFSYLQLEGGLFVPDHLAKAVAGELDFQKADDYEILPGLKLGEEISRYFQIAQGRWGLFDARRKRDDHDPQRATEEFVRDLLEHAFGYGVMEQIGSVTMGERSYPVGHMARGRVAVVIAPHNQELDEPDARFAIGGTGTRRKSPFQLAQEFLNASDAHLWALVSNGRQLRLLRDSAALTRPVWLEVDLEQILTARDWSAFTACWRLFHGSRAGKAGAAPDDCVWESWRKMGQETGLRVRDSLRQGVQEALLALGNGFLQAKENEALRLAILNNELSEKAYFDELLHLIYRFLFMFAVEERELLHPEGASEDAQKLYLEGYSQKRLRDRCLRPGASSTHHDLWEGQRIVWKALESGQTALGLPALGGLFASSQCPHLDNSCLSNAALLTALRALRWSGKTGSFASVDYRNMGPEELGSVYESLLELVPRVDLEIRSFGFVGIGDNEGSTKGNARKTSGSYYTPDSLVQELLKTSLDPVVADRLAQNPQDPVGALLGLRIIDTSCGSGHFLLSAARRVAERLAQARHPDGAVRPADYRHALRDVISHCIFGVDRNPMAVELARTALWLESFEAERPLSFLDHHLVCGDALLGLMDLKALELPIPDKAYAALSGDDKQVCRTLAKKNKDAAKLREQNAKSGMFQMDLGDRNPTLALQSVDDLPDDTPEQVAAKEMAHDQAQRATEQSLDAQLADAWVGAFLLPKTEVNQERIPTTASLIDARNLGGNTQTRAAIEEARNACRKARVMHWPLAFPGVFNRGGYDVVLGNPPWERIKLQEEEFFATRHALVAEAKNKAERAKRIEWLSEGSLQRNLSPGTFLPEGVGDSEKALYAEFLETRRTAEAASIYFHIDGKEGGRYPLTGVGDVNTYALFAETIRQVLSQTGRAGFIVPTGIATDDSTKRFFGSLVTEAVLTSLTSFREIRRWFPGTDDRNSFCLLSIGKSERARFRFALDQEKDLIEEDKAWELTPDEFKLINPNTLTCPTFRSRQDAELTKKIYRKVPVLWREAREEIPESNPWGLNFKRLFDMSTDSHLFRDAPADNRLPLYEAKMIHQFDHRWATYMPLGREYKQTSLGVEDEEVSTCINVDSSEKADPSFVVQPRYWVDRREVLARVARAPKDVVQAWTSRDASAMGNALALWRECPVPAEEVAQIAAGDLAMADAWIEQLSPKWLMGFRNIARSTDERTFIASVMPLNAVGHSMPLIDVELDPKLAACLLGCISSLTTDFIVRQKLGGTNMTYGYVKQFAVLPPTAYSEVDLAYIVPRVLELTYTAWDLKGWAEDLGYTGAPFRFDSDRRAVLRAELDARYARLYGLNRDELRYILDPSDVMGPDYPTETFRVLKNREMSEFGEYRTRRLVLEAWDREEVNG